MQSRMADIARAALISGFKPGEAGCAIPRPSPAAPDGPLEREKIEEEIG